MTGSLLAYVACTVAVISSAVRVWRGRRNLSPGVVYLCLSITSVGISAALVAPETITITAAWEPVPNATRLAANGAAVVAAFAVHGLCLHLMYERAAARWRVRGQLVLLAVTLATMITMLGVADTETDPAFVDRFADQWPILVYVAVFTAYIATAAARFGMYSGRRARRSNRPWLRRGQRLVQLGTMFAVAWAIVKIGSAYYVYRTGARVPFEALATAALSAGCVVLVALGTTLPRWGPIVARPVEWIGTWRAHRDIRPLRDVLTQDFPRQDWDDVHGLDQRLIRSLVDVRDVLLALAPYRPRHDHDGSAEAEADAIAAALAAWRAGTPPSPDPAPAPSSPGDIAAEIAWMRRVATAFARRHPNLRGTRDHHRPVPEGQ